MSDMVTYKGGCHCGAIRFEVDAPSHLRVQRCNCSICRMTGYLHLIVPRENFRLTHGEHAYNTYTFNTGVAKHHFCRRCGVKSFYVPRSHPDGISVNVNCIDQDMLGEVTIEPFDGQNWEQNVAELSGLSD